MTLELATQIWLYGSAILALISIAAVLLLRKYVVSLELGDQASLIFTIPPIRALVEYWKEHEWVFSLLFVVAMATYAWWATLTAWMLSGNFTKTADEANKVWASLAFQMCSSIGLALFILILTDFAGKRYLDRSLEARMQDLERSLTCKGKIAEIVDRFGIYCLPKIMYSSGDTKEIKAACGPRFTEVFNERHKKAKRILVVSTHGANWLLSPPASIAADSPFDILKNSHAIIEVVIYSPLLHYLRSVSSQVDFLTFSRWMTENNAQLSRATGSELLADHLKVASALKTDHVDRGTKVWVSPRELPSSFFIVDKDACYSGFPMWTRKHQDAIAVTIYSRTSSKFKSQMVEVFHTEFEKIKEQCTPFIEYFTTHEKTIREALAYANTHS